MKDLLLFSLLGLASGAYIAGLSMSAVLSYRGAGVVNLACGGVAMLGAYVFFGLRTGGYLFLPPIPFVGHRIDLGGPWALAPAMLVALAVCALTGALMDGIVYRRLRDSAPLAKLIATLGLLLTLQAIVLIRFGADGQAAPAVLPTDPVTIFGLTVGEDRLIFSAIVVAIGLALAALYRYSKFGLATRAAAEDEGMAMRFALSPDRLSMANTILSFVLAGALGVLFAPAAQLDSTTLALTIIPALAAALLARFTSFTIALGAGFAMGIIASLVVWLQTKPWFPSTGGVPLPGVTSVVYVVVIALVMFFRGRLLPERGTVAEKRAPSAPEASRILRPAVLVTAVLAVALIVLPFDFRQALINSLIGTMICLSLVVITGYMGQVSLLQIGLAGVTALVLTKLAASTGIGFPLAPLLGIAAAVVMGIVTALPTLRVRGVSLAIITMAAAVAVSDFWFANTSIGFHPNGGVVSPPQLLGIELGPRAAFGLGPGGVPSPIFGFLCLVATVGAGCLVAAMRRGELGQRMLAVRSNERAAAAAGINVRETKLVAYGVAGLLAGTGGALYAYSFQSASADNFEVLIALGFVAVAYLGGITTVTGAAFGGFICTAALATHIGEKAFGISSNYQFLVAGLLLIVTVVQNPDGIAGELMKLRNRRLPGRRSKAAIGAAGAEAASP